MPCGPRPWRQPVSWASIFLNGQGAHPEGLAFLAGLTQQVFAADGGYAWAQAAGVKVDQWLGDGDSIKNADRLALEEAGVLQRHFPRKKDETDSELACMAALDWLSKHPRPVQSPRLPRAEGLMFLAAFGERMDHVLSTMELAQRFLSPERSMLFSDGKSLHYLLEGPLSWTPAWLPGKGQKALSLAALSPQISGVSLTGTDWPLEQASLHFGEGRGLSNPVHGKGPLAIKVQEGRFRLSLHRGE